MIVEIFGPAGVGKTTFARALASALDARGTAVQVVSSARPAEQHAERGANPLLRAPLQRAAKVFGAMAAPFGSSSAAPEMRRLTAVLPPGGTWVRRLRLRRYMAHLYRSWTAARSADAVVIFDQGFVTLLSSLALPAARMEGALARGLTLIPRPDLLVRLDAPQPVLEARLKQRLARQSPLERLFENDVRASLRQIELAATLDTLLSASGRRPLRFTCLDRAALAAAVAATMDEIGACERWHARA